MPLQFLVPAFLAGLLAIAIPILVHLTRKRRAKVEPFPSLMFLQRVPYQEEERRRIQHWLLLALRAAAVALIVLAFARPLFQEEGEAVASTGGPTERVILLDRSYSMAVGDHWERALDAAREAVAGMGPLDRTSLVVFDGGAAAPVRSSGDPGAVRRVLDTLRVGDRATRYGPGLKLAESILTDSELPGRELVLVSDFQRAGWTGDEGVRLPAGTRVTPVALSERAPDNRSVRGVELNREGFQARERIVPSARLVRTGGADSATVEAVLEVDGRELQRREVVLPPSGAAVATFDPFTLADRHTRGSVRLEPADDLPGDDRWHWVLSPGRALPVLVLEAPSAGTAGLYVRRALEVASGSGFDVRTRPGGAVGAAELDGIGVVVVNDVSVPAASAAALEDFVREGGGLVVVLGERGGLPDARTASLLPARPGPASDRREAAGGRLGDVDYDHPVFEIFRGPRRGDFTAARFFRARSLQPAEDVEAGVLARFDDGSPALMERAVGEGRVLVWASTLDAFWNDLALQPVFVPFVHQVVRYASGRSEALSAFTAGDVLDVTDARAMATAGLGEAAEVLAEGEERVALTPSGGTRPLTGEAGEARRFLPLDEQGFYLIRPPGADDVRPLAVAVNADRTEGELEPLDVEEVVASLVGGPGAEGDDVRRAGDGALLRMGLEDRERRQSLWRFLLLGAFVVLAVETMWSNRPGGPRRALRPGTGTRGGT